MPGKRPRLTPKKIIDNVIEDEMAFCTNICSDKAKFVTDLAIPFQISVWFDKHYLDRVQHGDSDGPREGINIQTIEKLITDYYHHLFFYSAKVESFKFLNHECEKGQGVKLVFQDSFTTSPRLNVVVETHYEGLNKFQATVKTAMCTDSFKIHEGQYIVEIFEMGISELKRKMRGKITTLYDYAS